MNMATNEKRTINYSLIKLHNEHEFIKPNRIH